MIKVGQGNLTLTGYIKGESNREQFEKVFVQIDKEGMEWIGSCGEPSSLAR